MFRRVVVERFRLICNLAPLPCEWKALDVGCGSGRYALELAGRGASRVLGVDFAGEMIRIAEEEAVTRGVAERCEFRVEPFRDLSTDETFDVVVATGYFDYIEDPSVDLALMVNRCRGRIFASFPKRWEWRVPIRKLRFALSGSFVRFYGRGEVLGLFSAAGIGPERLFLVDLGRDWIAVAWCGVPDGDRTGDEGRSSA
ncbi:MAG: methyltransferase domain-containing protein [Candidatus Eisenbacteria bacterium]|nr:methyltransferase domain-containing protein [Candidatus Eisenbacteria bacterium]